MKLALEFNNPLARQETLSATPPIVPPEGLPPGTIIAPNPDKVKKAGKIATTLYFAMGTGVGLALGYILALNDATLGFMFGLIIGLVMAAWMINPWLKFRIYNNMGLGSGSYKGFLFIFYKGLRVDRKTFDIREDTMTMGERTYVIRPEHVYKIDGIPCAFAVAENSSSIPMVFKPDEKDIGTKWQDPKQLFAYITKMKNLIEARLARDKNKMLTYATYGACICGILSLFLLYMVFDNTDGVKAMSWETLQAANATLAKVGMLIH